MKKALILSLILNIILSCSSLKKDLKPACHFNNPSSQEFRIENNTILLKSMVNEMEEELLFDTGFSSTLLFWKNPEDSLKYVGSTPKSSLKDAKGEKIRFGKYMTNLSNDLINFKNISALIIEKPKQECENHFENNILGIKLITNSNYTSILMLDFDHSIIRITDDLNSLNIDGYKEVRGKINWNKIEVFLEINGKEYKFLFDTGNTGDIIMNENSFKKSGIKSTKIIEGITSITASGFNHSKGYFGENVSVKFMDTTLKTRISSIIGIDNNLGMGFIKNFNWIIDSKERKIYAKPINNFNLLNKYDDLPKHKALSIEGKLIVSTKTLSEKTIYNLNDQIISVSGVKITSENICEMQKLLNETKDWDALQIEIE